MRIARSLAWALDGIPAIMLEDLIAFVRLNGRVCPKPDHWHRLWQMLPDRRQGADGHWNPPLPVILGGWWDSPALLKMSVLEEQLRYAAAHGVLDEVDAYLRSLGEREWAHLGDF